MRWPRNSTTPWRGLWLIPVFVLGVLSIVATGGGSGGNGSNGGDFDDDGPVNIMPTYNFFLTNLPGDNLLTAVVGGELTVSIDIDGLFANRLDLAVDVNNNVTLLSYIARTSSGFDLLVSSGGVSPLDGSVSVILTEDISGTVGDAPISGAFNVIIPGETVTVNIIATGVQISLNGGVAVEYTWDEFEALFEDDVQETWQRRASLASAAFEFMYELFFTVTDALDELELVTLSNPTTAMCDMFTGSPPAGVLAQGNTTITWLGSGELADGDDFDWRFNQCWFDDATDIIDELVDGVITLENYTESVDSSTNTLFEIGFGGLSGQPGGVSFDLTISDTVEDQGIFTIPLEDVIEVSGGFAMIIQLP